MFGIKTKIKWYYFDHIRMALNRHRIRHKEKIRVLFVLTNISLWKTETLYQKMLSHERFDPILGIVPSCADKEDDRELIRNYCNQQGYIFYEVSTERTLTSQLHADVILYSQPYLSYYYHKHLFFNNDSALFVFVPYAYHSVLEDWNINELLYLHAWQYYFENDSVASEFALRMNNKGRNIVVTGLPMADQLLSMSNYNINPWKNIVPKKRIIFAPHHTIGSKEMPDLVGINYSTFLEYADFMVEMAEKYKNEIQIAFKPHPYLKMKLYTVWGEEKTETYYHKWQEMENTQLESGNYIGLFHFSDAMIHDSGSFRIEYLYTLKPVMFLVKEEGVADNCSQFVKEAFNLHEHGRCKDDIEQFIINVINGVDPRYGERKSFFEKCLLPPGGKSASDNIIEALLTKL